MNELPTISIVIPTFRREKALVRTLESVLEQSHAPQEVIVVDQTPQHDNDTEQYLQHFSARPQYQWIREKIANLPRARNIGTVAARGEVVLFLDDDVLLPEGFLLRYAKLFRSEAIIGACGLVLPPGATPDDAPPLPFRQTKARDRLDLPLCNYRGRVWNPLHFVGANMAFRRQWIHRIGGFCHSMTGSALGEDVEFAGRLRRFGGKTVYDSRLWLWHCRESSGGCRLDHAQSFARSRDRMRNMHFAVCHGSGIAAEFGFVTRRFHNMLRRSAGRALPSPQAEQQLDIPLRQSRVASAAGRFLGAFEGVALALRRRNPAGDLHEVDTTVSPGLVVAIPTLNRPVPLLNTLESLRSLYSSQDVLVIDQSDWRPRMAPLPTPWHIHLMTKGASRARNVAASEAPDAVLLFLDDDITALPGLIEKHLRHYADPSVVAVGGRIAWNEEHIATATPFPGSVREATRHPEAPVCYHTTPFENPLHIITCNLSVRASALIAVGGFHEWFRGGAEDIEFVSRLRRIGRVIYDPDAVVIHHRAESGGTRTPGASPFHKGYQKGKCFHFSALRSVGPVGWLAMQWRRNAASGSRALGTVPAGAPFAPRPLSVRLLERAGAATAALPALLLYVAELPTSGHYFRDLWRGR